MQNVFQSIIPAVLFVVAVLLLMSVPAHAYLDPGTGSYVLQIVIGVVLSAAFAVKVFWIRIRTFFGSLISRKPRGK